MSAHTPGPWKVDESCGGLAIDASDGNVGIVNLCRANKADARLIAAAPDLLALAHQYASECGDCAGTRVCPDDEPCTECTDIWRVIDKAEGLA